MKILKSFILVSMFLIVSGNIFACGPWFYSAADNRIYHFLPPGWQKPISAMENFESKNIVAWSRQTGCKDLEAIKSAIYTDWDNFANWDELLWDMLNSSDVKHNPMTENGFCRHLVETMDTDAVRLLCWSKTYSNIRTGQRSPWYYNSHVATDEMKQLQELYNKVMPYKPTRKYADRFKFLAIKCAWALGEDSTVITLWKQSKLNEKKNLFYYEAGDYAARSFTRMGRQKEADAIYYTNNNYVQLIPYGASTPTKLRTLLRVSPNSPYIPPILEEYISELDVEHARTYHWMSKEEYRKMDDVVNIARMAIDNPTVCHKAMWRYAAACVLDYKGKQQEALDILRDAEDGDGDAFMQKSVRTLTFYLRSRVDTINDDFERYAINEVRWLDNEMLREWNRMPDNVQRDIRRATDWRRATHHNEFYSYAALRRIILEDSVGLAWRMVAAGRGVRALQMANVADNHILQITDNPCVKKIRDSVGGTYEVYYEDDGGYEQYDHLTSLKDTAFIDGRIFYVWNVSENRHDYSNGLFCVADIIDAHTLEEYRQRQLHPKDGDDRWFNARSYTNGDYWQDIVGTHYLRERNYHAAATHFKYVSPSYQQRMNISCPIDPFSIDRSLQNHDNTHYKLHFARRMDSLQRVMLHDADADKRGLAMLEYTIGLANSFDMCWWLTSYDKGWNGVDLTDIEETQYAHKANAVVKQLRKKALRMLRTNEARARYHLRLGQYTTVRKRYADTETGKHLALVCDERKQYQVANGGKETTHASLFDEANFVNGFGGYLEIHNFFNGGIDTNCHNAYSYNGYYCTFLSYCQ